MPGGSSRASCWCAVRRSSAVIFEDADASAAAVEKGGRFHTGDVATIDPPWMLPDDVAIVPGLPHTATGKLMKTRLREMFRDHKLPDR